MKRLQVSTGEEYVKRIEDVFRVESRERILQEFIIYPFMESICTDEDVIPVDIKVSGKIHNYMLYCGCQGYIKDGELKIVAVPPDLCIAKDWVWLNGEKNKSDYIATVEIKTVYADNEFWVAPGYMKDKIVFENKIEDMLKFINEAMLRKNSQDEYDFARDEKYVRSLQKQVGIHLRGIGKVIVTDGVRWIFFYKKGNKCFALPPIDLGKRICQQPRKYYHHVAVEWNFESQDGKEKCLKGELKNFELLKKVIKEFLGRDVNDMDGLCKEIKNTYQK